LPDDRKLKKSLIKVKELLNENGILIVGEVAIPRFIEFIQNRLRPIMSGILSLLKKPEVRFFSRKTLANFLVESGFENIEISDIGIGKKVVPAPVLFPKLKIPGKLYPFKIILVEARACQ
jgi:hypothetical protein